MPDKTIDQIDKRVRSLYEKAQGCLERGQFDYAIDMFQNVLVTEPGFLQARRALRATEFKKVGGKSGIGKLLGSMVGSATGSPALAKAAAIMGKNPEGAMAAVEKAIAQNPTNAGAHQLLSQAAENGGYLLTATFAMATARDVSPNDISILLDLGRLFQLIKDGRKATECYERVLAIKPGNADAVKGLKDASAVETMTNQKWDEAESYRELIKDTDEAVVLEQQSRIMRDLEGVTKLLNDYYQRIQAEPDNFVYYGKMAELYLEIEDFDNAVKWLEYAHHKCSGSDVGIEKSMNRAKSRKIEHEMEKAERALKDKPDDPELTATIARLEDEKKKLQLLQQEMLVRRYPNDMDARFELGQLYFREERWDDALKEFQMSAASPKLKVLSTHYMGRCLISKKMFDLAIPRFKAALGGCELMDGVKKEVLYDLGRTYEMMGREEDAITHYKLIYEVDIGFKDVGKKIEAHYKKHGSDDV
jgi:tetratricopeptide (TPR) repeat protein